MKKPKVSFDTVEVTTRGGDKYLVPAKDRRTIQLLKSSRTWGITSLNALKKLVPNPTVVIDVGSNIGMSILAYHKWAKFVYGFEPHPELYALAKYNLERNTKEYHRNFDLSNWGLGAKPNEVAFTFTPSGSLGAHISGYGKENVTIAKMDRPFANTVPMNVHVIKLDVEGYELEVLKGAKRTIKKWKPIILAELEPLFLKRYGATPQDVVDFLTKLGYEQYTVGLMKCGATWEKIPRQRDRIFIHEKFKWPKQKGFFK